MQTEQKMEENAWQKHSSDTEMEKGYQMKQGNLSKNTSFLGGGNSSAVPKCMICKHCITDSNKMKCKAFPDGIPDAVFEEPYEKECKKGIKFQNMK